jgi:hypothetical protein
MFRFSFLPIKSTFIAATLGFCSVSLSAHATLTSYTANGKDLVYSSVSDVTWTKDGNLLGTLFTSQGFNTVVNAIVAASPTISNTPNFISPTGSYTISASDFSVNGQTTWFGALAYVNYLNSIKYAGSNQWYLPIVANEEVGSNTSTNGTSKGDELVELFYQELNGTDFNSIPNTASFDNEQSYIYWSGTESATYPDRPDHDSAWHFLTYIGYQDDDRRKDNLFYAWAVSPGKVVTVPEPETVVMLLLGLGVVGGVVRCRRG